MSRISEERIADIYKFDLCPSLQETRELIEELKIARRALRDALFNPKDFTDKAESELVAEGLIRKGP